MDFINEIQLHPTVKSKQYVVGHLPSILENLVCIMHFQPDYEQPIVVSLNVRIQQSYKTVSKHFRIFN